MNSNFFVPELQRLSRRTLNSYSWTLKLLIAELRQFVFWCCVPGFLKSRVHKPDVWFLLFISIKHIWGHAVNICTNKKAVNLDRKY
jgi:hypothetical protein